MEENIFWDKKLKQTAVKRILKDEQNPRFAEIAALLLSRTNKIDMVFGEYLGKVAFCRNWRSIKRQMRSNKWNDARINYWDAVYKVAIKTLKGVDLRSPAKKNRPINPEAAEVGRIIRDARKDKKLTQKELAQRIRLSQQVISFVERGYLNFSFETLLKITKALNLEVLIEPNPTAL